MNNSNEDHLRQLKKGKEYVVNLLGLADESQLHLESVWGIEITRRIGEEVETGGTHDDNGPLYLYKNDVRVMALQSLQGKVDLTL